MHAGAGRPFQLERLRRDGAFRTEVAYCADKGIPHSEFLSRWSNEDRAKLVAALMDKADRCSMCGTAEWEWLANPQAYVAAVHDCMGCSIKAHQQEQLQGETRGKSVRLITWAESVRLKLDPTIKRRGPGKRRTRPKREKS